VEEIDSRWLPLRAARTRKQERRKRPAALSQFVLCARVAVGLAASRNAPRAGVFARGPRWRLDPCQRNARLRDRSSRDRRLLPCQLRSRSPL
jgi:hypothetical protein